jgi:hypothetical protein
MRTFIIVTLILALFGCNSQKRMIPSGDITIAKSFNVPDSTSEPGYNATQRAFAWYLKSLSQEERNKWISTGSFTENEKDKFLEEIDTLKMDIQLPDPPNSIIPDTFQ